MIEFLWLNRINSKGSGFIRPLIRAVYLSLAPLFSPTHVFSPPFFPVLTCYSAALLPTTPLSPARSHVCFYSPPPSFSPHPPRSQSLFSSLPSLLPWADICHQGLRAANYSRVDRASSARLQGNSTHAGRNGERMEDGKGKVVKIRSDERGLWSLFEWYQRNRDRSLPLNL